MNQEDHIASKVASLLAEGWSFTEGIDATTSGISRVAAF